MLAQAIPTPTIDSSSKYLVVDEAHRQQSQRAAQQAEAVRMFSADDLRQRRQEEGEHKANGGIHAEADTGPFDARCVGLRSLVGRAENIARNRHREVEPHAEQPQPCE